jgi:hypothetical protein
MAAVLAAGAGTARTAQPQPVTLSVQTIFADQSDPFTASGGIVCGRGTVSTPRTVAGGGQSGFKAQLLVAKHFVCSDGTFDLLLQVTLMFDGSGTTGTWSVVGGTGAYKLLHGTGSIVGTPISGGIDDEYSGALSIG